MAKTTRPGIARAFLFAPMSMLMPARTIAAACVMLLGLVQVNAQTVPALVFVERQIAADGNDVGIGADLAGVGAHSRVRPAAPGRLLVRESNGTIRVLVNGAAPTAPFQLIDVSAPAVSYDGAHIVFAGLAAGAWSSAARASTGGWRLYLINADGSGLHALTTSDVAADYSQFGSGPAVWPYDDYDPAYLPDGRIVFASTRWPAFAQFADVRASNLWIVNAAGNNLHRITSERNGADRPLIDPVSGKIVYFRWWRNQRLPDARSDDEYYDPAQPALGYVRHAGLSTRASDAVGNPGRGARNGWQIVSVNPDGSEMILFGGKASSDQDAFGYGGGFASNGVLYANFFPSLNLADAAGFGGIRSYSRGQTQWSAHSGVVKRDPALHLAGTPENAQLYNPPYTTDPEVIADGRIVFCRAAGIAQDYGLWIAAPGNPAQLLYDNPGTAELHPRALLARPAPPVLPDVYRDAPTQAPYPQFLPPPVGTSLLRDGSFVFDALNVYANANVDVDIPNAPAVGSAASIRFFADHQRTAPGTFASLDWPLLIDEKAVSIEGRVQANAPAFLPLFEQLRSAPGAGYEVPRTNWPRGDGAAHVAGMNHDRAGVRAVCSGCHAGHTLIAVPTEANAPWSNLAPGATLRVSSQRAGSILDGLIDRKVFLGPIRATWTSAAGQTASQWAELEFPVPVVVRNVRLYNPRPGDEANSSIQVTATRVSLRDVNGAEVDAKTTGSVLLFGTDVAFTDVPARRVRVEILGASGTFDGSAAVGLAEIEVIAKGAGYRTTPEDRLYRDAFDVF
ncbi:MAG: hypothetical protein ABI411_01945 [Tahibacter sp.]